FLGLGTSVGDCRLLPRSRVVPNRGRASSLTLRGFRFELSGDGNLPGDGPHEGGEFAGDGRHGDVGVLAARNQPAVAFAEAYLSFPGDVLDGLGEFFQSLLDGFGDLGGEAVGPGSFDEGASGVTVSGFGDGAEAALVSRGVLAGREAEVGGELAGGVEAGEVADLGEGSDRDGILDAAKRLEGRDEGRETPRGDLLGDHGRDASQSLDELRDGAPIFLEDDLLGRGGADDLGEVTKVGVAPVGLSGVVDAEAEEEGLETELGGFEVLEGILAGPGE